MSQEAAIRFELEEFNRNVPNDNLLQDLVAANEILKKTGKALTFRRYREVGKYAPSTIHERFGSWNTALEQAGLNIQDEKFITVGSLFDNLKLVWISKGKQPVFRDMKALPSKYSGSTYAARFGGWRNALAEFVSSIAEEHKTFSTSDTTTSTIKKISATGRDPSLSLRFAVLKRDNFRCVTCGRSPANETGIVLEVDHHLAWSKGGITVLDNLRTLCFDCNRGKSST